MARHRLDLLPLLDVFMVVLFVFATIQEQRLDDSTRGAARLRQRVAEAEAVLRGARAHARDREKERRAQQVARDEQQADALVEVKREADHLRRELQSMRQALADQRDQAARDLQRIGAPAGAIERIEILSRVLDKYSVFEVEIVGRTDDDGVVVNECCFRVDPLVDEWSSCGLVPLRAEPRARWLERGAGGLVDALRRTKGGNAMTLVRQDHAASHRIASRLVEQLRERFSDQHVYAEEEPQLRAHCAPP